MPGRPGRVLWRHGWLGMQNSLVGLGLVLAVLQLPFGLFMMRNSFGALPVALSSLQSGSLGSVDFGAPPAGVVVSALPCVAVFLVLQRYYVRGFTSGALKG